MYLKVLFVVSALVILLQGSSARTELYLSLDSAKHYALMHNRSLISAGYAVDEADMKLRETIAQGLPQINAAVDYNNFFGSTATLGALPGFEIEFNPTSNFQLSVGQMIFSGSYIVGVQTARLFREITETNLEKSELETKAQVIRGYYLCLISNESRSILKTNLENINDMLAKTRLMVDTGVAEELDYDQLAVQASMLENAYRASGRQVEMAFNLLRLQLGLDAGPEIILTDDLAGIVDNIDFHASLLNPFYLHDNPDFRLVQLQTSITEKQINLERSAYLPSVTGFYNFTEKLLKPEFDITPNHVIGLNISIPVFSSGVRQSRVRQARINLEVAENQKEFLSEQLMIQEKQLRYNLNNALEQYESQRANVQVAKRVFESIRLKYEQGMVSSLDITTASNNYLQAENSYISAMLQLLDAQVEMNSLLNNI